MVRYWKYSIIKKTRSKFEINNNYKNILPKENEKIWFDEGLVIKYFKDKNIIKKGLKEPVY